MKANKLADKKSGIQELPCDSWNFEGMICGNCETQKGIMLVHDFESDPGKIWEVVQCSFCGHDYSATEVTKDYSFTTADDYDVYIEKKLTEEDK